MLVQACAGAGSALITNGVLSRGMGGKIRRRVQSKNDGSFLGLQGFTAPAGKIQCDEQSKLVSSFQGLRIGSPTHFQTLGFHTCTRTIGFKAALQAGQRDGARKI